MLLNRRNVARVALLALLAAGCAGQAREEAKKAQRDETKAVADKPTEAKAGRVVTLQPGPKIQDQAQTALIKAKPGDVIEFGEGTFEFTRTLSLTVDNVTIRGKGEGKTFLSFKDQEAGAGKEGILVNRDKFTLENLTVQDTKGDAIKVNGGDGVTFRHVSVRWMGGAKESNGAYGVYPVQCKNVLVEDCEVRGASDAGIYVGQSKSVIVRRCRAQENVAGIEIENCEDADVYENVATDNAGGLLVFDLPGLQQKNGRRVRVFDNQVYANNHANFAPKGNIVATVAPGTGLMVMATDQVEVFKNTIKDNQTYGMVIVSFLITGRPIEDKQYDPFPEGVYVHDNTFTGCGVKPAGERGQMMAGLLGTPLPDIIYDGVVNPAKLKDGHLPAELGVYVKNNGSATFANLHWDKFNPKDLAGSKARVERNAGVNEGELATLPQVQLPRVR